MPHLTPAQLAAISGVGVWHALITEIVIVPTTNVLRFTLSRVELLLAIVFCRVLCGCDTDELAVYVFPSITKSA